MWRFFTTLGVFAVAGFLALQQGLGALQSARPIVDVAAGSASDAPPLSIWAPPAEIAAKVLAEHRSVAKNGALIWQPPAEISEPRVQILNRT